MTAPPPLEPCPNCDYLDRIYGLTALFEDWANDGSGRVRWTRADWEEIASIIRPDLYPAPARPRLALVTDETQNRS